MDPLSLQLSMSPKNQGHIHQFVKVFFVHSTCSCETFKCNLMVSPYIWTFPNVTCMNTTMDSLKTTGWWECWKERITKLLIATWSIDQVAPFFGCIADRICGEVEDATIPKIFTMYTDLMQHVLRLRGKISRDAQRINAVKDLIENFKSFTVDILHQYQPSNFNTVKWHMLDHIPDDLRMYGGLEYLDAGLYEYAHTIPKDAYRRSSRRHATALSESIMRLKVVKPVIPLSLIHI